METFLMFIIGTLVGALACIAGMLVAYKQVNDK